MSDVAEPTRIKSRSLTRSPVLWGGLLAGIAAAIGVLALSDDSPLAALMGKANSKGAFEEATIPPSPNVEPAMRPKSDLPPLELVFVFGSEKQSWLKTVTKDFLATDPRGPQGQSVRIKLVPMGSGESMQKVVDGDLEAHLVSPASGIFVELGNAAARAKSGKPLVTRTRNLVLSPVVIAMWKPMAEALGHGKRPLGWADFMELSTSAEGWAKYQHPEWGRFRFGHTHPEYSNSGIIAALAEVYAGANKLRELNLEDVRRSEVTQFVESIEGSVVHYGESTGFFGERMFARGQNYIHAAVLYENMVIESYADRYKLSAPLVAIYPREGTFWSDHPAGIVERPWVSPAHQKVAEAYLKFLLAAPQQQKALELGFRPADLSLALGAPLDAAHGVDPAQPQTTLEVPSAPVIEGVLGLWRNHKKRARVTLVIDVSGSMLEDNKFAEAKTGLREMLERFGDQDEVSLLAFSHETVLKTPFRPMATSRAEIEREVESLRALGTTALYDALLTAYRDMKLNSADDAIQAIVVLSDGADTDSQANLSQLLQEIKATPDALGVRIFSIAYGKVAEKEILKEISVISSAQSFDGSPANLREVLRRIATYF